MKCHYEVLEISQEADDSQIKTAYRKLALKWHPDKNLDDPELAKEQFQLVQQAYEVLSDRQERAWYDNHREQILHGSNTDYKDDSLDVYQYFTSTCFKGYGDDENGFYTIYCDVFDKIMKEDLKYMDDKEEFCEIPIFGTSTSSYENIVGPFYAYWMSYTTKKSYVWLDPYNIKETRDRKILKLMEKENKKVRQKARKERNEEVRALVLFVKKRDKRVQEQSKRMEAKVLENRQKQEEISKQKRMERKKLLNESNSQAEWSKFDNVKTELEQIEKNLAEQFGEQLSASEDDEDQNEELDNLYCVACNKVFKTEKAFQNHESSKKHKENIQRLKKTMLTDEETDNDNSESSNLELEENFENFSESDISQQEVEIKPKKKQRKSKNVIRVPSEDNTPSLDKEPAEMTETVRNRNVSDSYDFDFNNSATKSKRKSKKATTKSSKVINGSTQIKETQENCINDTETRQKYKNKKVKQAKIEANDRSVDVDTSHCCVTCKTDFPSKNKLFDHLKKTGHSVYLPQNNKMLKNKTKIVKEK